MPIATLLSGVERAGLEGVDALKIGIEGFEDRPNAAVHRHGAASTMAKHIYMDTDWAARSTSARDGYVLVNRRCSRGVTSL